MEIDYISGPRSDKIFGMYKYQMEIQKRLNVILNIMEYDSIMQNLEKRYQPSQIKTDNNGLQSRFTNNLMDFGRKSIQAVDRYRYRQIVKKHVKPGNLKHITTQEQAYLLKYLKLKPSVVTCYDLIPWVYENNRSKIWKDNMDGLKKADKIITISEFSKDEIIKYLDFPEENIHIVNAAVDHELYRPLKDKSILKRFKIPENTKTILYVGSETPRMNIDFLMISLAKLKKIYPDFILLKIGLPQSVGAREHLLNTINQLGLEKNVIFVGYVAEEELPLWYNAADMLVYPCLYAGFGLPPLEAMACGMPVITSNTSSLPEVVGDAGIMVDPTDEEAMSKSIFELLTNESKKEELIQKGLKQSKLFQWDDGAKITEEIYRELDNMN
jgi:glycosyltransferase involved in cell wall biosynthesis